jgi:hypothetical protein
MANFHTKIFSTHDDYMTPRYAWENIQQYIPKNKTIWEAFYGDGTSGQYLRELGFNVIHESVDFFENDLGEIIVTNPPFSKTREVMHRLLTLDKPFILILPASKINTSYFRAWKDKHIQIIIPRKRIQFLKLINGEPDPKPKNECSFDCFYYCYKMDLPQDIMWLDDSLKSQR